MANNIWKGIFGQERPKNLLYKIYASKKIPHAFLFSGPDGVGKYFTAIRFAQILNSGELSDLSIDHFSSNVISQKIAHHSEPYIKFILPLPRGKNETSDDSPLDKLSREVVDQIKEELDNKIRNPYYHINIENANNIKISSIREIKRFLSMNFDEVNYRIIIISDAHLMNDEAQNALLKNLEEPPEGVIFILLSSNKNLLLETIMSRCWVINFEPLSTDDLVGVLTKNFDIEENIANSIAPFSNGSVCKALEYLRNDFENIKNKVINILRYSLASKYHSAYKEIQPLISDSSGSLIRLAIQLIIFWLVDVQKNKNGIKDYFFNEEAGTLEKFNLRFSDVNIEKLVSALNAIELAMGNNVNLNLIALNIIFELASLRFNRMKSE